MVDNPLFFLFIPRGGEGNNSHTFQLRFKIKIGNEQFWLHYKFKQLGLLYE